MNKGNYKYSILKDRNIVSFNSILINGLTWLGCFGTLPLMFIFESKFGDNLIGSLITILGPVLVFTFIGYILYQLSILPFKIMENLWNTGKKLALLKQYGQQRILDFQEIYNHGKEVYKINKSLLFLRKTFGGLLTKETIGSLEKFFIETSRNTIAVLTDLRSDLATRLTEQQQILEGAKSEVEQNITGTPEVLAVSELQKARLDRQIEQFEELQMVLVRV